MTRKREIIRFLLNDESVELSNVRPADTLLDFLRLRKKLTGTKEGCAEGDCGACTVLVGRLQGEELVYETVNSCIRFIATLDACHVVTIEHLRKPDSGLHPVQQSMVEHHGSQCGFCTPGIVMSLYGLWMTNPNPDEAQIERALQGNLCRCTGYEPIIKAAKFASDYGDPSDDPLHSERNQIIKQLKSLKDGALIEIESDGNHLTVPFTSDQLAEVRVEKPDSVIVSGSTDVGLWVNKHMRDISPAIFVSGIDDLRKIEVSDAGLLVGACVTYSDFQHLISRHFPQMAEYWNRIGGEQVRNMGTIGGNIANGSPIGDTPPPLIALGSTITLRRGNSRRTLALEEFFLEYGKQDREAGDFLESVFVPFPGKEDHFAVYKISKRFDEDISAVTLACRIVLEDEKVAQASIVCGGMAGVPKRAATVEKSLVGKAWDLDTVDQAIPNFRQDYTPLTDWRASSEYRQKVTENLFRRFYLESIGQHENLRLERKLTA